MTDKSCAAVAGKNRLKTSPDARAIILSEDLLSLSPLIIINNIISGVLSIIAFYLTFYVAFLLHRIVGLLSSVYLYRIVAIQSFGCNTLYTVVHSFVIQSVWM